MCRHVERCLNQGFPSPYPDQSHFTTQRVLEDALEDERKVRQRALSEKLARRHEEKLAAAESAERKTQVLAPYPHTQSWQRNIIDVRLFPLFSRSLVQNSVFNSRHELAGATSC